MKIFRFDKSQSFPRTKCLAYDEMHNPRIQGLSHRIPPGLPRLPLRILDLVPFIIRAVRRPSLPSDLIHRWTLKDDPWGRDVAHESAVDRRPGKAGRENDPSGASRNSRSVEGKVASSGRTATRSVASTSMFEVTSDAVFVQDLGSRNGTELNGKKLAAHEPTRLKNGDLVKVGPLTFAVSIEGAVAASAQAPGPVRRKRSLRSTTSATTTSVRGWSPTPRRSRPIAPRVSMAARP